MIRRYTYYRKKKKKKRKNMFTRDKKTARARVCHECVWNWKKGGSEVILYCFTENMPCPSEEGKQKKRQKKKSQRHSYSIDFMCEISYPIALFWFDIQEWFIPTNIPYLCNIMLTPFCFQYVYVRIKYIEELCASSWLSIFHLRESSSIKFVTNSDRN